MCELSCITSSPRERVTHHPTPSVGTEIPVHRIGAGCAGSRHLPGRTEGVSTAPRYQRVASGDGRGPPSQLGAPDATSRHPTPPSSPPDSARRLRNVPDVTPPNRRSRHRRPLRGALRDRPEGGGFRRDADGQVPVGARAATARRAAPLGTPSNDRDSVRLSDLHG